MSGRYGKYADKTDNTEHVVDNIFTLLATAFGLNAATSEAGLAANGMENALAGQAAITPDGTVTAICHKSSYHKDWVIRKQPKVK